MATLLDAYKLFHDASIALSRSEQAGIRIDLEYCRREILRLTRRIEKLEDEFKETNFYKSWKHIYGDKTNIGSDEQLAHILYDIRKLEPIKKTSRAGRGSTEEETLRQLGIPEIELRIESGKLQKLRDTYLDSFVREAVNEYIHPFFNVHKVRTYRSSSDHPNFQNLPQRDEEAANIIRRAMFPRHGHQIGSGDYGGLEVCIGACYHRDPNMITYIIDPDTDMHRDTAQEIFLIDAIDKTIPSHYQLRYAAKNGFVFPEFYGDYYKACAQSLACHWGKLPKGKFEQRQGIELPDGLFLSDHLISKGIKCYEDFEDHVKTVEDSFWNKRFRIYKRWKDDWWEEYQRKGYFDMYTGFRCSGVMSKKEVCNYPVQGSAYHCLQWSFNRIDTIQREERWDTRLIGQIHDQVVMDINPEERDHVVRTVLRVTCQDLPKEWDWIIVPLSVDIDMCEVDRPWCEKKKYKLAA